MNNDPALTPPSPFTRAGEIQVLKLANGSIVVVPSDVPLWIVQPPIDMVSPFGTIVNADYVTVERYVTAVREHADSVERAAACVRDAKSK